MSKSTSLMTLWAGEETGSVVMLSVLVSEAGCLQSCQILCIYGNGAEGSVSNAVKGYTSASHTRSRPHE